MTISQSSSDNTQLAEIMYGQLYILISQGNPSPEFATTIVESIAICQYEYTIAVNAFQYLLKVNVPFSS